MCKTKTVMTLVLGVFMLILAGCGKPLFVATMGAEVYHKPDCKYVANSLEKYGPIKRVNYYTILHKDLSGRKPCPKCIK